MELNPDELDIVELALQRCSGELNAQMGGKDLYTQVTASAWFGCRHVRNKIETLLQRIENTRRASEELDVEHDK